MENIDVLLKLSKITNEGTVYILWRSFKSSQDTFFGSNYEIMVLKS